MLEETKKRWYAKIVFKKYIDEGYDKLIAFYRDYVVGENEKKPNLLLPSE